MAVAIATLKAVILAIGSKIVKTAKLPKPDMSVLIVNGEIDGIWIAKPTKTDMDNLATTPETGELIIQAKYQDKGAPLPGPSGSRREKEHEEPQSFKDMA